MGVGKNAHEIVNVGPDRAFGRLRLCRRLRKGGVRLGAHLLLQIDRRGRMLPRTLPPRRKAAGQLFRPSSEPL